MSHERVEAAVARCVKSSPMFTPHSAHMFVYVTAVLPTKHLSGHNGP